MRIMALMHRRKVETIWTPIGRIPMYQDLQKLFAEIIGKEYKKEVYTKQFSIYTVNLIERIDRSIIEFSKEKGMHDAFFHVLSTWRRDLVALQAAKGRIVTPDHMMEYVLANMAR